MKRYRGLLGSLGAALVLAGTTSVAAAGIDREVLDEINYARAHPAEYAQDLRQSRGEDGRYGGRDPVVLAEAVAFLGRQRPLPPLAFSLDTPGPMVRAPVSGNTIMASSGPSLPRPSPMATTAPPGWFAS
jgi:hypothetical protein